MLATGGSADAAIGFMKEYGCRSIKLMVLLAAPEGIERLQKNHPDVDIYCGAVDEKLNEHGYIVLVSATPATASSAQNNAAAPPGASSRAGKLCTAFFKFPPGARPARKEAPP